MNPEVKGLARGLCTLVGIGGLGLGTFATFETDNEIGTSALLFVGSIASLIALLGRVPRIKVGENEIDPSMLASAYAAGARKRPTPRPSSTGAEVPERCRLAARHAAEGAELEWERLRLNANSARAEAARLQAWTAARAQAAGLPEWKTQPPSTADAFHTGEAHSEP